MIRLKGDNVNPGRMSTAILFAILIAEQAYDRYGYETIITSLGDGKHMEGSLHYPDELEEINAVDLRTRHIRRKQEVRAIEGLLREWLNDKYDIVVEDTHIHLEYDPKEKPKAIEIDKSALGITKDEPHVA